MKCTRRIQDAQRVLSQEPISGWAIGLLYVGGWLVQITLIAIPYLVQDALNKIWRPFEGIDPHAAHDPQLAPISIGAIEMLPRARSWDTSGLSDDDHNAITHFLLRRDGLATSERVRLAGELGDTAAAAGPRRRSVARARAPARAACRDARRRTASTGDFLSPAPLS